ncbi:hypothetical protein SAMN05444004_102156 [Jannaschia faecimaris]|uniref:Response regulatory domain-containing protein n=1 Tax=Jannaschia faecimaris TaxID=1244108 RepID=A0A1H3LCB6_9RHOB|nr:hypothetical protein [Jannaschia faecimaris]SDY62073.1 hypothetical protein SAMN05444004_102156 [Jannaschia faecimaris]
MIRPEPIVLVVGQCFETKNDYDMARKTLSREGIEMLRAADQHGAALRICEADPAVVLIDLTLKDGSPLAVADFCNYRRPDTRVILLRGGNLMADGSLFAHVGNAAALVSDQIPTGDLMALVAFHAGRRLTPA